MVDPPWLKRPIHSERLDLRVVLFDIDGVLISHLPFRSILLEQYGISENQTAAFFHGVFIDCQLGKADLKTELTRTLGAWGWPDGVNAFTDLWYRSEATVDMDVLKLARSLQALNTECHLATMQERGRMDYLTKNTPLGELTQPAFPSWRIGSAKSSEAFYQRVLMELEINPCSVLLIDDRHENLVAARRCGINGVLFQSAIQLGTKLGELMSLSFEA